MSTFHPISELIRQYNLAETYVCTNETCKATTWFVKEISPAHWQLGYQAGQSAFQIASNNVICPLCAKILSKQIKL